MSAPALISPRASTRARVPRAAAVGRIPHPPRRRTLADREWRGRDRGIEHLRAAPCCSPGTVAHVAGWCILPSVGWRRVVVVVPSTISMWLLLPGPRLSGDPRDPVPGLAAGAASAGARLSDGDLRARGCDPARAGVSRSIATCSRFSPSNSRSWSRPRGSLVRSARFVQRVVPRVTRSSDTRRGGRDYHSGPPG